MITIAVVEVEGHDEEDGDDHDDHGDEHGNALLLSGSGSTSFKLQLMLTLSGLYFYKQRSGNCNQK